ncbi:MAG: SRPBCC domain-containing protein, partial [Comamonadaceae bacterium]|nr:SRPBCC domain-containing protein [Comamonadaceae bacterium]
MPVTGAAERAIDKEIVVAATLDEAWDAWTTREGIVSFFAPDAVIESCVGGAFHIHIDPTAPAGQKGAGDMRFMALQPKKMLSLRLERAAAACRRRARSAPSSSCASSRVGERQTRVSLHHTGWGDGGDWDKASAYFDRAWGNVLGNLKKRFDSGPHRLDRVAGAAAQVARAGRRRRSRDEPGRRGLGPPRANRSPGNEQRTVSTDLFDDVRSAAGGAGVLCPSYQVNQQQLRN